MDEDKEIRWRTYELHMNLFKHYLSVCLNINLFYYGITGALISFYFQNKNNSMIILSLVLPFIIGLSLIWLFMDTKKKVEWSSPHIISLANSLGINFVHISPDTLVQILKGVIFIMALTQIGILSLFINEICKCH